MRACHHGHMARTTRQRAAVRAVFQDLDGFHSAQEVHARLRSAGDPVGLSTVYRAVQSLADDGELDSIRTDTGEALYRRCSPQHHHHLVCRVCAAVEDVDCATGSAPCLTPAQTEGFLVDEAEVTFWGVCSACQVSGGSGAA